MRIRLFDFLNAFPYQKIFQEAGLEYELYPDPKALLYAWQKDATGMVLVPFAAIPRSMRPWCLEWGLASQGCVESVLLLSEWAPHQWKFIICDTRSTSSVVLLKLSMQRKLLPSLPLVSSGEEGGARLVIGDEALRLKEQYPYRIDLGELAWKLLPLPMPFAVWCGSPRFHSPFRRMLQRWRKIPPAWIEEAAHRYGFSPSLVREYWGKLRYHFSHRAKVCWHRLLVSQVPQ